MKTLKDIIHKIEAKQPVCQITYIDFQVKEDTDVYKNNLKKEIREIKLESLIDDVKLDDGRIFLTINGKSLTIKNV